MIKLISVRHDKNSLPSKRGETRRGEGFLKAQIVSEYVLTFFLIIAVVAGMSVYVRRAIQARIHEARNTMITMVNEQKDFFYLGDKQVFLEYEPYYINSQSLVNMDLNQTTFLEGGGSTGIFKAKPNDVTRVHIESTQAPPKDAD